MPCNDWGSGPGPTYITEPLNKEMKKRLDLTTRLLCGVLTFLTRRQGVESRSLVSDLYANVPGLREWWARHQEKDRQREIAQREARNRKDRERKARIKSLREEADRLERGK